MITKVNFKKKPTEKCLMENPIEQLHVNIDSTFPRFIETYSIESISSIRCENTTPGIELKPGVELVMSIDLRIFQPKYLIYKWKMVTGWLIL